ncbi:phosphoenolpyruvate synthase [Sulfuriferula plumbiphila]|uniref:Phosphoenolpyruvate synthase n=1 Tax=Sulfuriferula plumbiphila TaxID=171865 RepID=A0A512L8F0_9PROT|nr:phosphoenolpyruvate synthase [Sulfuriferula plumbiphila]BBP05032.1 phosphoenolpyruvate synthase [Sulfuriferula plumbiphila]GEP30756.1 phosphoenolpyruvate synthase [Sulfuriferula plumbiphila]
MNQSYIIDFTQLKLTDVPRVGGKNASLGEMIGNLSSAGVNVPGGFATTAQAFRDFLDFNNLTARISDALGQLDVADVTQLAATGRAIRDWVAQSPLQPDLEAAIRAAYAELGDMPVAVRSSATAEDLPNASFAGQQETYLNIQGADNVLAAIRLVFASLYNDRAIAYRVHQGFGHDHVALSAGVQRMVRSDLACSGVMFTLDTESGFDGVVFITAAYGLGETVVQGQVNPDEYYVHKPTLAVIRRTLGSKAVKMIFGASQDAAHATRVEAVPETERRRFALTDSDVLALARQAIAIEQHYGRPMDIEWAKDGVSGALFIVQARPETVKARGAGTTQCRYALKQHSRILAQGRAIGSRIGQGAVRNIASPAEMARVQKGDVLVTDMTDPDWEPVMRVASAIVTNRGGRTCHAAIIARELGIPAVVGAGDATTRLMDDVEVTVSCAEGDTGFVYEGRLEVEVTEVAPGKLAEPPVKIMMNVGNPERAFDASQLPNHGVGLARLEFIINNQIGIHPRAALDYPDVPPDVRAVLEDKSAGYGDPVNFYVEKLAEGVATLGAAFWPKPVIVRLSDFKSNEYANLPGGRAYEPVEENPMLGLRGAARYVSPLFRDAFALECRAVKKVRESMGLTNVELMIPFVRTVDEARAVVEALEQNGLKRGKCGLRLIMMCEVPSNVILAHDFLQYFDGYSIGSNDLTQLTLGIDRDSSLVAASFDERNPAVKALLSQAISACKQAGKYVGICGQGPSDHPDLADWLVAQGIDSLSLNPDTVLETWERLAGKAV